MNLLCQAKYTGFFNQTENTRIPFYSSFTADLIFAIRKSDYFFQSKFFSANMCKIVKCKILEKDDAKANKRSVLMNIDKNKHVFINPLTNGILKCAARRISNERNKILILTFCLLLGFLIVAFDFSDSRLSLIKKK